MSLLKRIQTFLGSDRLNVSERFEVERESSLGTMSQFLIVRDRRTRQVCGLKLLDPEKTKLFEARFPGLQKPPEGEIAIAVQHPRVVQTYEYGTVTDGRQYVLMEYLPGSGLNTLIRSQSGFLDGRRLSLIRQMTEALQAVHEAGYIHRDICPRNYICAIDLDSLKLIDFGLTVPATPEFMLPGNRTGTPQYMAPEIVRRRKTDHRVDIFALGVTAYQLCTGELPWGDAEVTGKAALAHDTRQPQDIFLIAPDLNPVLGKTIMRCLATDPLDRPESAEAVLLALSKVENEKTASAGSPPV